MRALGIVTLTVVGAGALALVGALAAQHASSFWSDADTISRPPEAPVRSILWRPARAIAGVNTSVDEYEAKYSPDGTMMVFVRRRPGRNADLFMSRWSPAGWSTPEVIAAINSDADELGPEIAGDGGSLYFYSDRAGGRGGYDLWVSRLVDGAWTTARNLGDGVNTEFNEYGPALTPDGKTLYFSSNRPREGEDAPTAPAWDATMRERHARHDYDLYQAGAHDGTADGARPVAWANTTRDEGAPAVSPAGDYLYFASDRDGGMGGYDLYRARINDPRRHVVENLGESVNSPENELDPGLSADGFRLTFSSDRKLSADDAAPASAPPTAANPSGPAQSDTAGAELARGDKAANDDAPHAEGARADRDYNLWSTASREVFLDHRPIDAKLAQWINAAWPWVLLLLLAALLLWLLSKLLQSELWRRRFAQMSLLARCLLVSLVIHALIASLLTIWRVGTYLGELMQSGGTRVVLASSASEIPGDITSQFSTSVEAPETPRLEAQELELPRLELPTPEVRTAMEARWRSDAPPDLAATSPSPQPTEVNHPNEAAPVALQEQTLAHEALPRAEGPSRSSVETTAGQPELGAAVAPLRASPLAANVTPTKLAAREASDTPPEMPSVDSPNGAANEASSLSPLGVMSRTTTALPASEPSAEAALPSTERPARVAEAGAPSTSASLPAAAVPHASEAIEAPSLATPLAVREPSRESLSPSVQGVIPPEPVKVPEASSPAIGLDTEPPSLPARAPLRESPLPPVERPAAERPATPEPSATYAPTLDLPRGGATLSAAPIDLSPVDLPPMTPTPRPRRDSNDAPAIQLPAGALPVPSAGEPARPDLSGVLNVLSMAAREPLPTLPPELPQPIEDFAQRAPEQRSELVEKMGGSQETERAVARALEWLRRAQEPDGGWSSKNNGGEVNADTAMTGMALLCFLSAGHTHTRDGPYRDTVSRAIEHLMSRQRGDGNLAPDETMYGQTVASVALCEAYAMTHDARLARPVRLAVEFVDASARSNDGSAGKTSVLGWQVMAMESARRAGVKTSNITFDAARRWLDSVGTAGAPGRYAYQRGQAASPAMTAEAMFVQQLLGHGAGEARMEDSARFILEEMPRWRDGAPTHSWYYATLALFQHQGEAWARWNDALVPELLAHQHTDGSLAGSWEPQDRWSKLCGRVHQTAVCTLSLEVYYRYRTRAE
ncbi:MAG: hypothetical protein U0638_12245 [Phycisphaerales bacterium]